MRNFLIAILLLFGFLFFQITGYDLAKDGNIVWTLGYVFQICGISLVGGMGIYAAGVGIWRLWSKVLWSKIPQRKTCSRLCKVPLNLSPFKVWLISFVLPVLCMLPAYLAYYPGICAYDVTIQTGQIESGMYNDHHPLAHTLLLEGAMKLGNLLFEDVNAGIGILTFIQVLLFAGLFSFGVALLYQKGVPVVYLILLEIFGMAYPFHSYMTLSVIKDVPFSIFFVLQLIVLCEMIARKQKKLGSWDAAFFFSSIGMQLFRNNGRYAMLALLVFLLFAIGFGKKHRAFWGKLTVNCVLALVVGSLCLSGLFRVTNAEQGDRREMLSMPIQQLARCMLYHGGVSVYPEDDASMEEADRNLIRDFLLDESYKEYRPEISDPVKSHTNTYVVRYRSGDFIRTYWNLFKKYPGDFINAALAVNAGYLYVGDVSHSTINQNGTDKGLGYVQTRWVDWELNPRGIYQDSKWEGLHVFLEKWADENQYLQNPIGRFLMVPGVFLWCYLALLGILWARKAYEKWIPLSLVFGYYVTLFLGPTVQLRYLYPLMLALPFLAVFSLLEGKEKHKNGEFTDK